MKKAWEIEKETLQAGWPVILKEEEQGWNYAEELEAVDNQYIKMRWESHVPGSNATEHIMIAAVQAMENLGYDVSEAEAMIERGQRYFCENDIPALLGHTARMMHVLTESPINPAHPHWKYTEYTSFEQYASKIHFPRYEYDCHSPEMLHKTHLGWQGQIVGGALGTAIEGYTTDKIREAFGEIRDYVRTPNTYNDDITFELALLKAVEEKGKRVTSDDIAEQWVAWIPMAWSAEEIALNNLKRGIFPPESGRFHNPYQEWIGAQMRGAICGMLYPGRPEKAAELAFADGQISHSNNGILGEVFNAVMTSLAYVVEDVREIVQLAATMIPSDSEYYGVISFALEQCHAHAEWEAAWRQCEKQFEHYNWIHAYPNAAAEIIALWFSNGDFDQTMHIGAMEGMDADCNLAQIGTIVAIGTGRPLADHWIRPLGDTLNTFMRQNEVISVRGLSERTVDAAKKIM